MPLFVEDLCGTLGRGADPESGHALELAAARFRAGAGALAAEGDWCYKDGRAPTGRVLHPPRKKVLPHPATSARARWPPRSTANARTAARPPVGHVTLSQTLSPKGTRCGRAGHGGRLVLQGRPRASWWDTCSVHISFMCTAVPDPAVRLSQQYGCVSAGGEPGVIANEVWTLACWTWHAWL